MTAPFFLLVGPIVLALFLFPLRRWPRISALAGAASAWLIALIVAGFDLNASAGDSWTIFGRAFTLTEHLQPILAMVYALLGAAFLLSAVYHQSAIFVSISLVNLSLLSGALMVEPFVFGAALLLVAAGAMATLIQGSRAGSTLASLRYLSLTALAVPLLLSAGWMLESDQFRFLDNATLLILVATLLLTTTFPFQIWVAPAVGESTSLTPTIVFGLGQLLIVVFCISLLIEQPFVYGNAQFQDLVRLCAAATLILAGLLAMTARSFGHLLGYLLLLSIGAVGATLGSGGGATVNVIMALLTLRVISLIIAGAGLAMVRVQARTVGGGANQFAANRGLAWRTPLGTSLFVFGCLSLAGLPLTPGFAGTWPAILLIGQRSPWLAMVLILTIAAGAFGVLRRLIPLLGQLDHAGDEDGLPEGKIARTVAVVLLAFGVILAVFPHLVLTFSERIATLFSI
jgi:NADH:ubiquinone oxidoreductase subunit 2 (subunit N)